MAKWIYVFQMCRERAMRGDGHLMMVRDPDFHGHMLAEGGLRDMMRQLQEQAPTAVFNALATKGHAVALARPGARGRRRR